MTHRNPWLITYSAMLLWLGMSGYTFAYPPIANAFRDHPVEFGSAVITGANGTPMEVTYEKVHGYAIFEGDILLGTVEALENQQHAFASNTIANGFIASNKNLYWPYGLLPYEMDPNLPTSTQDVIANAITHWETHTVIRFVKRTALNPQQYPDYVRFTTGEGICASHVGRQGHAQEIWFDELCDLTAAIHEIGHALGLWHEHTRSDRDQYVRIHWNNIQPGKEHNFERRTSDGEDIGLYDYASIMHYPRTAFSVNSAPTIEPLDPQAHIGEGNSLSQGDIETINSRYGGTPGLTCDSGESFSGSLSGTNDVAWLPSQGGYVSAAGMPAGQLAGPANADFDLYLFYWTGDAWVMVAQSTHETSSEHVSYSGESGYYIWGVASYEGSGSYTFCLPHP